MSVLCGTWPSGDVLCSPEGSTQPTRLPTSVEGTRELCERHCLVGSGGYDRNTTSSTRRGCLRAFQHSRTSCLVPARMQSPRPRFSNHHWVFSTCRILETRHFLSSYRANRGKVYRVVCVERYVHIESGFYIILAATLDIPCCPGSWFPVWDVHYSSS